MKQCCFGIKFSIFAHPLLVLIVPHNIKCFFADWASLVMIFWRYCDTLVAKNLEFLFRQSCSASGKASGSTSVSIKHTGNRANTLVTITTTIYIELAMAVFIILFVKRFAVQSE